MKRRLFLLGAVAAFTGRSNLVRADSVKPEEATQMMMTIEHFDGKRLFIHATNITTSNPRGNRGSAQPIAALTNAMADMKKIRGATICKTKDGYPNVTIVATGPLAETSAENEFSIATGSERGLGYCSLHADIPSSEPQ